VTDLPARRELNRGAGDALSTAFELSVTPVLIGLVGWGLDVWIGTSPVLLLVFFLFTVCYEIWKHFVLYDAKMRDEQARVLGLGRRSEPEEPGA
jgi:F0F1-type ATP synthase assembly protein I